MLKTLRREIRFHIASWLLAHGHKKATWWVIKSEYRRVQREACAHVRTGYLSRVREMPDDTAGRWS